MSDYVDHLRIGWRSRDSAYATHLRRDIVHAARCCEFRLREAARIKPLYPQFDDFGGLRRNAEFWSGNAFNASNALQRLKQRSKGG